VRDRAHRSRVLRIDFLRRWRADRARRAQASTYVATLLSEPTPADVLWLAREATGGDEDHARWELRYARRAAGMLAAQRDALDDRTASLVSAALGRAWRRDPRVAPDRRDVATRQFNTRLAAYADALSERDGREPTSVRLARVLLGFSGQLDPASAALSAAEERLEAYLREASDALSAAFGTAVLPEDVPPSGLAAARK
jgi:hypothetical protein